jgi:hypothetical protein
MEETDIGHRSVCKYFDVPIIWVEDIRLLPHGKSQRRNSRYGKMNWLTCLLTRGRKDPLHLRT